MLVAGLVCFASGVFAVGLFDYIGLVFVDLRWLLVVVCREFVCGVLVCWSQACLVACWFAI